MLPITQLYPILLALCLNLIIFHYRGGEICDVDLGRSYLRDCALNWHVGAEKWVILSSLLSSPILSSAFLALSLCRTSTYRHFRLRGWLRHENLWAIKATFYGSYPTKEKYSNNSQSNHLNSRIQSCMWLVATILGGAHNPCPFQSQTDTSSLFSFIGTHFEGGVCWGKDEEGEGKKEGEGGGTRKIRTFLPPLEAFLTAGRMVELQTASWHGCITS